jgi:sugar-specific transcriptional regulator TrmB
MADVQKLSVLTDIFMISFMQPMDNSVNIKLVAFLKQLGLDDEQAKVYLYLQQYGASTVLAISRGLETGRTKLYPALEEMVKKQVVATHERNYGTTFEALPPENLEFLVSELERKADIARHNFKESIHAFGQLRASSPSGSKVVEYSGLDGLKQMNWNLVSKAKGHYKVFELEALASHAGFNKHFKDKLDAIEVKNKLATYDITNNPTRTAIKSEVPGRVNNFAYIDPKVFKIQFETYIYNNVVALLSYEKDDIFGVEIHNDKLADQQKQLFDLVWSLAKPV